MATTTKPDFMTWVYAQVGLMRDVAAREGTIPREVFLRHQRFLLYDAQREYPTERDPLGVMALAMGGGKFVPASAPGVPAHE
jgi:hypothetical protein